MKRYMMTLAVVLMCFGINAFAEDDGYGNEIPTVSENTTSVYRDFSSAEKPTAADSLLRCAFHLGIGLGAYWDYPSEYLGDNDWLNIGFDLGMLFKFRVNPYLSVVPELNFGFIMSTRKVGDSGSYTISENRGVFGIKVPVTARYNPIPNFYLEAGPSFAFNFATMHYLSAGDGNSSGSTYDLGRWSVNTFVPSLIFGLGGTMEANTNRPVDFGVRFILDLGGIEKDGKMYLYDSDYHVHALENKTKMWNIQVVMNYHFK